MKPFISLTGVLAITVLFAGCIYDTAVESRPTELVEARLLGDWQEKGEPENRMLIRAFDRKQYAVITVDGKSVDCYRAFTSHVDGLQFTSVQTLDEEKKWAIFEYRIAPGGELHVRMLNDKIIPAQLTTPGKLRRAIKENRKNPGLFLKETTYVKSP